MAFRNPHRRIGGSILARTPGFSFLPRLRRARRAPPFESGLHLEFLEDRKMLSATSRNDDPAILPTQHNFFSYNGYLTSPSSLPPVTIAENFLRAHTSDLGILQSDLNNYIITTNYVTQDTGATTLTFEQSYQGLPVFDADYNITVARDGRILSVGGGFVPGLSQRAPSQLPSSAMTPQQAATAATNALGMLPVHPVTVLSGANNQVTLHAPSLSSIDVNTQLHYVITPGNNVQLAWNLTIRAADDGHWYRLDVDANSGSMSTLVDFADYASYEVIPKPFQNPNDSPRVVVTDPQIMNPAPAVVPSPFGWHDTDGVVGPEFSTTSGNNVIAYADRNADNQPDTGTQPDGGANLDFTGALVPIDPTQDPSTYTNATVTNLFYWTNLLHDIHYLYGFDEAARNFQVNNYGRGGIGGDPVHAQADWGADVGVSDNSFFAPLPDGQASDESMFVFTSTNPERDGSFEPTIIIHEYGHGVSNRLTGNTTGLDALQSGGMGEGWSDWWALMLTQKTSGETNTPRGIGTYVLGEPLNGPGIRQFEYQFAISNPAVETFAAFGTGAGQVTEAHDAGTLWAATLWDINHMLIDKYGYDANVEDSTSGAGNIRALHLVMTALKIQALNPTFLQARDAILMADQLLYNGADQFELWTAFARRGLGVSASTPDSNSTVFHAAFDVPASISMGPDVAHLEGDSGVTNFVFSVNFTGILFGGVTVEYSTLDGTATAGSDYIAQAGTLTFDLTQPTTQFITIAVLGDVDPEANETFFVQLSNPVNTSLGRTTATGTIQNDDVNFSINDVTVREGDSGTRNAVFTVSAFGVSPAVATVSFGTSDGTANGGNDYSPTFGVLTFQPGVASQTISVPIVGDRLFENTEDFFVNLFNPVHGHVVRTPGIGTILDDDLRPSIYVNDAFVKSLQADLFAVVFTVALDVPSGVPVTVNFSTQDDVAKAGINYVAQSGVLTFAPGETTQFVTVPVVTGSLYAPNERFFLNLSNPVNAELGDSQGIGTIVFAQAPGTEFIQDDGDPAYSQTNGWTNLTNLLAYQLDYDYHAAGNGNNTATWTFNSLPSGSYQVFARWVPFSNRATNAPYTVFDGQTPEGTVLVNQQLSPAGDLSNGITWQSLGTFTTSTNQLRVSLSDNANGYVVADAIRIVSGALPLPTPEMDVSVSGHSIGAGTFPASLDNGTDFGDVASLSNSVIHTFKIANTGNSDLHLSGSPRVIISGDAAQDFTVLSQPAVSVAPGSSTNFTVMFHPTVEGLRQATVTIFSDDSDESPYTFTVQGTGQPAGPNELIQDDLAALYQPVGSWSNLDNDLALGAHAQSAPAGTGANTATWTFAGLAPAQYDVYATWVPFVNRATNAPYTLTDGTNTLATVAVNQKLAPVGQSSQEVVWQSLGSFNVGSGTLKIALSNSANGFVIADGVRIVRHDPPPGIIVAHNDTLAQDVNGDTRVSSTDVLIVINKLLMQSASSTASSTAAPSAVPLAQTAATSSATAYYADVNRDGMISPRDALMVINYLLDPPTAGTSAVNLALAATDGSADHSAGESSTQAVMSSIAVDQAVDSWSDSTSAPAAQATVAVTPAAAATDSARTLLTPVGVGAYFAAEASNEAYDDEVDPLADLLDG